MVPNILLESNRSTILVKALSCNEILIYGLPEALWECRLAGGVNLLISVAWYGEWKYDVA